MQNHNFITSHAVLHIKNMVSHSCVKVVREELQRTGFIQVVSVSLGEAEINYDGQLINMGVIATILERNGFELITDNNSRLIEQIKKAVIEHVFYGANSNSLIRNSDYLSERLGHPYPYLSKLFSESTNTTLEKYIILIKIEKIKELITYDEHSLSEVAYMMGYSSVQYLSNQFKQITGLTVSEYKSGGSKDRKSLSEVI
ncbi:MAG: AraC family transcriptional regulator [Flavobacteriales bacterium]